MQTQGPTVIVTQPGFVRAPQNSNWQTGLCDCFSDCGVCKCEGRCLGIAIELNYQSPDPSPVSPLLCSKNS